MESCARANAPPAPSPRRYRDLLIALNASPTLAREAICRLGRSPGRWAGDAPPRPSPGAVAEALGVKPRELRSARSLVATCRRTGREQRRRALELGAEILVLGDPEYPAPLLDLELPPPVLYRRGRLCDRPAIAIVGSRRADPYGLEVTARFAAELATYGLTVISGFARGVDTAAHRGALSAPGPPGGRTVAVLGCGLDFDYPAGSAPLAARIAAAGALVTEFPLGFSPRARNFPIRNRIIAALSLGTLVVRAAVRSGSLITARLAVELGRDVYAVPGRLFDPLADGPNRLIQDGALLAQRPLDIVESLTTAVRRRLREPHSATRRPGSPPPGGAPALRLLEHLPAADPLPPDALAARAGLPVHQTLALLLELELAGRVRRHPGPAFCRSDGGGA